MIYRDLSILFEKSKHEIKKEHWHKKSKTMHIKQKISWNVKWDLCHKVALNQTQNCQSLTLWTSDVETKLRTAGKLPCSIESTNTESSQQICTTVDMICFYVREVYTAKELQADSNYNRLWNSFKLLKYLNDPFLNLIPREH